MYKNSILIFIFSSLAIHFLFFTSLRLTPNHLQPRPENQPVEIEILTQKDSTKEQQIVSQEQSRVNDDVPTEDSFLGRHNQDIKKQTRVEKVGKLNNKAGAGDQGNESGEKQQKTKSTQAQLGEGPTLRKLAPGYDFKETNSKQKTSGQAAANDDNLDDIPIGMETVLRTKEFLYYTYFARIKDKLRKTWGTKVREKITKMARRGRYIASTSDKVTKLIITLNKAGTLVAVQVVSQSGIVDLDDAAIEAFKAAAPFPNPPSGMIESDGKVRISWDLVLEA